MFIINLISLNIKWKKIEREQNQEKVQKKKNRKKKKMKHKEENVDNGKM